MVHQQPDDCLGVDNDPGADHLQGFGPGHDAVLDLFFRLPSWFARRELAGDEQMHVLVQNSRGSVERGQLHHLTGPVAGFFDEFPVGAGRGRLALVQGSGRQLDQRPTDGDPVVFDQADAILVQQGQDDDRAGVANHLPLLDQPAGQRPTHLGDREAGRLQDPFFVAGHDSNLWPESNREPWKMRKMVGVSSAAFFSGHAA